MANPTTDLLEMILRECAGARPQPWYPSEYAQATGLARAALDPPLDQLRLGGLIRLTDWEQGKGQGYTLTPAGEQVLDKPRLLGRLREGVVPVARVAERAPRGQEQKPPGWERAKAVKDALLGSSRPVVTLWLVAANILLFVAGAAVAHQDGALGAYLATSLGRQEGGADVDKAKEIRHRFGMLHRDDILGHNEWWRLLGCCFVHVGFLHLAMNMYALYVLGPLAEKMWGSARFLILYLISGLCGSCAAMVLSPSSAVAGASGAICGVIGMLAAWVYLNRPYLPPDLAGSWMRGILINVVLIAFISFLPGISFAGHLGGGVGGLIAAVPMVYSRFGHGWQRWLGLLGALAVPLGAVAWVEASFGIEGELARARARLVPQLEKAEAVGNQAYEQHVKPLCVLVTNRQPIPAEEARASLAAADKALEELRQIAESLPEPGTYHDARINAALEIGKDYVSAWIRLCEQFRQGLGAAGGLSRAGAVAVLELWQAVQRHTSRRNESVLFSRK
jgi:membrane associated rhomboid family serine protease